MRDTVAGVLVLALAFWVGGSLRAQDPPPAVAFVAVNVVPMDAERIVERQTVLVKGVRIAAIGPVDVVELPPGTIEVDGTGKYIMPGLADMHVHIFSEDELQLYVANGVTVVRNMWGWSLHLGLRERIRRGELLGPRIYTAGPLIDGDPPRLRGSAAAASPEQAERIVAQQVRDGYDFLKVYDGLSPEAYGAVLLAARAYGVPVVGHVPDEVGLHLVLAGGQAAIEHLRGYPAAVGGRAGEANWSSELDTLLMIHLARTTQRAGVWNIPTLVVSARQDMSAEESRRFLSRSEIQYLPAVFRRFCCARAFDPEDDLPPPVRQRRASNRHRMVRALEREGARLLLGTDTGNPFVIPGFAVHDELRLLVEAGLTPYQAILAATRLAAEFMGDSEAWGTVEVGKQADLLLLHANPLQDVAATATPLGVMLRGRWLPADSLGAMLARLAAHHGG